MQFEQWPSLNVRLKPEEVSAIADLAESRGISKAAWLREVIRRELKRNPEQGRETTNDASS
jgi:predicted HicB family RNase H-like nuclease